MTSLLSYAPSWIVRVFLVGIAAGCGSQAPSEGSIFDRIDIPVWRFDAESAVIIGGARTGEGHLLNGVVGAVPLADGGVVVADGGSDRLLWFDENGDLLRAAGRGGAGPGEFRSLSALFPLRNDEILAYDAAVARASRYGNGGRLAGTFNLNLQGLRSLRPDPVGVLGDEELLFLDRIPESNRRDQPDGVFEDSVDIVVLPLEGAPSTIVTVSARRAFFFRDNDGFGVVPVLFDGRTLVSTLPEMVVTLDTRSGELKLVDRTGAVRHQRVLGSAEISVDARWVEAAKDTSVAAARARWSRFTDRVGAEAVARATAVERRAIEASPAADTMAGFSELSTDPCGRIWVGEATSPDTASRRWVILDSALVAQARIELPVDAELIRPGCRRIILRTVDELGVEEIRVVAVGAAGPGPDALHRP